MLGVMLMSVSLSSRLFRTLQLSLLAIAGALLLLPAASAQTAAVDDDDIEEVVVTGTLIRGTPIDAASPVSVLDRSDLEDLGDPSLVNIVRNLGVTSGNFGETNQFQLNSGEGLATINLRGLGPERTLVLLNGARQPYAPYATADFVDINQIPSIALQRIEVLKEGAAVTYGSDAVAGVANFLTRKNFTGMEVSFSFEDVDGSDADTALGFIWGAELGNGHLVVSVGQRQRNEVNLRDKDWHTNQTFALNNRAGYSSIGNPGIFYAFGNSALGGTQVLYDPHCEKMGGQIGPDAQGNLACRFRYTTFDNLKEDEKLQQIFVEYNAEIAGGDFHFDFLSSTSDVPKWATSPSYPPQRLFDPVQTVLRDHPGYIAMRTAFPTDFARFCNQTDKSTCSATNNAHWESMIFRGRTAGAGGVPWTSSGAYVGSRDYSLTRFNASYEFDTGSFSHKIEATIGSSDHNRRGVDTWIDRTLLAFRGFGGPNCGATVNASGTIVANGATAGQGNCEYYNPFSNAIQYSRQFFSPNYVYNTAYDALRSRDDTNWKQTFQPGGTVNPNYTEALGNSAELLRWLWGEYHTTIETESTILGYSFQKDLFTMGGGDAVIAAGVQYRDYSSALGVNDEYNLTKNPCRYAGLTTCDSPTGRFSFLSGSYPGSAEQTITAVFSELALPISENLDMQVAARFEKYENTDTFDPKFSVRWTPMSWMTFRASYSSSFRGPSASQIIPNSKTTQLAFVTPALAFKAIDIHTNPNLKPESADTTNIGLVFTFDAMGLTVTADLWDFDFSDPIIREPYGALVATFHAGRPAAGSHTPTAAQIAARNAVIDRMFVQTRGSCSNTNKATCTGADIERVTTNYVNGPSIKTSGLDVFAEWIVNLGGMEMALGGEYTQIDKYDVGSYSLGGVQVIAAYNALGDLNVDRSARPLPERKLRSWIRLSGGAWVFNAQMNNISSYNDIRDNVKIDSMTTYDANFSWNFDNLLEGMRAYVVVTNVTDEDPPRAHTDLGYDAFTHNPFGRTVKAGFSLKF